MKDRERYYDDKVCIQLYSVERFQGASAVFQLRPLSLKVCLYLSAGTGECSAGLWFSKVLFYFLRKEGL